MSNTYKPKYIARQYGEKWYAMAWYKEDGGCHAVLVDAVHHDDILGGGVPVIVELLGSFSVQAIPSGEYAWTFSPPTLE